MNDVNIRVQHFQGHELMRQHVNIQSAEKCKSGLSEQLL